MMMFDNLDFKCYIDHICLYDRLFIVKEAGYKVCEEYSPIAYYWASHNIAERNVNDTIYYMAHIYFYMPWGGWIFADDIGNHHAELSKTNRIYSI